MAALDEAAGMSHCSTQWRAARLASCRCDVHLQLPLLSPASAENAAGVGTGVADFVWQCERGECATTCAARNVMNVFECARLCKAHGTVPPRFHTAGEVVCLNLDKLRYVFLFFFFLLCLCCHVPLCFI